MDEMNTALVLGRAQQPLERAADLRTQRAIYKEGAKALAVEQAQYAKFVKAAQLTTELQGYALRVVDQFTQDTYNRLAADTRTQEGQAYFESISRKLLALYAEEITGLVHAGAVSIGMTAAQHIDVPEEEKKRWWQ